MNRGNLVWAVLAIALVLAFDRMMRIDQANLCRTDATAYEGCSE
jgi:hypothetical protein